MLARRAEVDDARADQALAGRVAGEDDVLGQAEARHGAMAEPLLRHEGGTQPAARVDAAAAAVDAVDADRRRRGRRGVSPDSASNSSSWPLPATPAMPTISPPRTSSDTSSSATAKGCGFGSDRSLTARRTGASSAAGSGAAQLAELGADHQAREPRRRSPSAGRIRRRPCRGGGWWRGGRSPAPPRGGG